MIRRNFDIAVKETGNGGDYVKVGGDIGIVYGRENKVYVGLFGGNVEESTPVVDNRNRRAQDYWANTLMFRNQPIMQFNSKTERTLNTTAINSAGRLKIENAVRDDLQYLVDLGASVTVSVDIPGLNKVKINVITIYSDGERRLTQIDYVKNLNGSGDFVLQDFTDDFK